MHHKELPYAVTLSSVLNEKDVAVKVKLALEHLHMPFCESLLMDRTRLSKENAAVLADYIVALKREINPRASYVKNNIQFLSELSRFVGIGKRFEDLTKYNILSYLDSLRKSENDDPMHKWIGSYNVKSEAILRFYKWLYYQNIEDPKKRNELSKLEKKPECIVGIRLLKRKEISCYKPSDLWTQEDDKLFLKWVTNKRDRCYHIVARDLSARPRYDSPDPEPTPETGDCYRDGYEAGFAGKYDDNRASECYEIGLDWYNKVWNYACTNAARSESECNDIRNDPTDLGDHEQLDQENLDSCYDSGYDDGQNNPFDHDRNSGCNDYQDKYYDGFIAGCESARNTKEICDTFTDQ